VCLCLLASSFARAAEPSEADKKGFEELRALFQTVKRPTTRAEMEAMVKELRPKLAEFAEKHKKDLAGAQALIVSSQMAMQTGQAEEAVKPLDTIIERYPEHPGLADVKTFRAAALAQLKKHEEAKAALLAIKKDHPDYRGMARIDGMLKQIAMQQLVGKEPPAFTTKKLDGTEIKLADLKGKVVLLDFFAAWCGPCRAEVPNLKSLYARNHGRGFEILGVSLDRSVEEAKKYAETAGLDWIVTWDEPGFWKNPVAVQYGIQSIPAMYLIDKEGKVLHVNIRGQALEQAMLKLFPKSDAEIQTMRNLSQLAKGANLWLLKFGGSSLYPESLESLREKKIIVEPKTFLCPASGRKPVEGKFVTDFASAGDRAGYNLNEMHATESVMFAWEKKPFFGTGRYVVFHDGHYEYLSEDRFEAELKKLDAIIEKHRPKEND
jgi:peroxiredoxin